MTMLILISFVSLASVVCSYMTLDIATRSKRTRELARKTERKAQAASEYIGRQPDCPVCIHPYDTMGLGPRVIRDHVIYHEGYGLGVRKSYREIPKDPPPVKIPNLEELALQIAQKRLPKPHSRPVVPYDEDLARAGFIEPEMVKVEALPPIRGANWSEQRQIIEANRERALNSIARGVALVQDGEVIHDFDRAVKIITEVYWKRRNQLDGTPIPHQETKQDEFTFVWHPVEID